MFDTLNGLPLHPLVVHAIVVLFPLSVLGTVAVVLRARWAVTYGWLLIGCTAVATVLTPVATQSGEALEKRVGDPGKHADLGGQLIWFAVALLILDVAWVLLARREQAGQNRRAELDRQERVGRPALVWAVAAATLVAAVATGVQVYRVGDSGARSAWGGVVQQP